MGIIAFDDINVFKFPALSLHIGLNVRLCLTLVFLFQRGFVEAQMDDGLLEIFGFKQGWHASLVMVEIISAKHIAQVWIIILPCSLFNILVLLPIFSVSNSSKSKEIPNNGSSLYLQIKLVKPSTKAVILTYDTDLVLYFLFPEEMVACTYKQSYEMLSDQASAIRLEIRGGEWRNAYMQMDGEPWKQSMNTEYSSFVEIKRVPYHSLIINGE
ncbi:hypothetical protein ZIOFF_059662 [Zingiber officinale]|uniref:Uncharacterized protein n=1 Tax=Zingiber officinale TaxID=94328 RepID=A0A8J5F9Q7_ZINOF|nr:hypothetical protein ZIOFF_059662 [Zingiber officinale]